MAALAALNMSLGGSSSSYDQTGTLSVNGAVQRDQADLLRSLYEQRLRSIVSQLKTTLSSLSSDPVFRQLTADPASASYLPTRIEELITEGLTRESEGTIRRLSEALAAREAQLRAQDTGTHRAQEAMADMQRMHASASRLQEEKYSLLQRQYEALLHQSEEQRALLTEQMQQAQAQAQAAEKAREAATALAQSRQAMAESAGTVRAASEEAVSSLYAQLNQASAHIEALQAQSTAQQKAAQGEMHSLRQALTQASEELARAKRAETEANERVGKLRGEVGQVQELLQLARGELDSLGRIRGKAVELEAALAMARQQVEQWHSKATVATHQAAAAQVAVTKGRDREAALARQVQELMHKLETSKADSTAAVQRALVEERRSAEARVLDLTQEMDGRVASLEQSMAVEAEHATTTIQRLETATLRLRDQLSHAQMQSEAHAAQCSRIKGELEEGKAAWAAEKGQIQARVATLEAQGHALQSQLIQAQGESAKLEYQLQAVRDSLSASEGRVQSLQAELLSTRSSLEGSIREKQALQGQLQETEAKLTTSTETISSLRSSLQTSQQQCTEHKLHGEESDRRLADSRFEVENMTKARTALAAELKQAQADLVTVETRAAETAELVHTLRSRLDATQAELRQAAETLQARTAEVAKWKTEADTASRQATVLQDDVHTLSQALESATAAGEAKASEAEALQMELADCAARHAALERQSAEAFTQLEKAQQRLQAAEEAAHSSQQRGLDLASQVQELESALDDARLMHEQEVTEMREEQRIQAEKAQVQAEALTAELVMTREALGLAQAAALTAGADRDEREDELQQALSSLTSEIDLLRAQLEDMERQQALLEDTIARQEVEYASTRATLATERAALLSAREEGDRLYDRLTAVEAHLEMTQEQLHAVQAEKAQLDAQAAMMADRLARISRGDASSLQAVGGAAAVDRSELSHISDDSLSQAEGAGDRSMQGPGVLDASTAGSVGDYGRPYHAPSQHQNSQRTQDGPGLTDRSYVSTSTAAASPATPTPVPSLGQSAALLRAAIAGAAVSPSKGHTHAQVLGLSTPSPTPHTPSRTPGRSPAGKAADRERQDGQTVPVAEHLAQMQQLQAQLDEVQAELVTTRQQLQESLMDGEGASSSLAAAQAESHALRAELEAMKHAMGALRQQVVQLQEEVSDTTEERDSLDRSWKASEKALASALSSARTAEETMTALQVQVRALQQELEAVTAAIQARLAHEASVPRVEPFAPPSSATGGSTDGDAEADILPSASAAVAASLASSAARLDLSSSAVGSVASSASPAAPSVALLDRLFEQLDGRLSSEAKYHLAIIQQCKELVHRVSDAEAQTRATQEELQVAREQLAQVGKSRDALQALLNQVSDEQLKQSADLAMLSAERESSKSVEEQLKQQIEASHAERAAQAAEVAQLTSERDGLQASLAEADAHTDLLERAVAGICKVLCEHCDWLDGRARSSPGLGSVHCLQGLRTLGQERATAEADFALAATLPEAITVVLECSKQAVSERTDESSSLLAQLQSLQSQEDQSQASLASAEQELYAQASAKAQAEKQAALASAALALLEEAIHSHLPAHGLVQEDSGPVDRAQELANAFMKAMQAYTHAQGEIKETRDMLQALMAGFTQHAASEQDADKMREHEAADTSSLTDVIATLNEVNEASLLALLQHYSSSVSARHGHMSDALEAATRQVSSLQGQVASLQGLLEQVDTETETARAGIATLRQELLERTEAIHALRARVTELEEAEEGYRGEVTSLSTKLEAAQAQVQVLAAQVEDNKAGGQAEAQATTAAMEELRAQASEALARADKYKGRMELLRTELLRNADEADAAVSAEMAKCSALTTEVEGLQAKVATLNHRCARLVKDKESYKASYDAQRARRRAVEAKAGELSSALELTTAALRRLDGRLPQEITPAGAAAGQGEVSGTAAGNSSRRSSVVLLPGGEVDEEATLRSILDRSLGKLSGSAKPSEQAVGRLQQLAEKLAAFVRSRRSLQGIPGALAGAAGGWRTVEGGEGGQSLHITQYLTAASGQSLDGSLASLGTLGGPSDGLSRRSSVSLVHPLPPTGLGHRAIGTEMLLQSEARRDSVGSADSLGAPPPKPTVTSPSTFSSSFRSRALLGMGLSSAGGASGGTSGGTVHVVPVEEVSGPEVQPQGLKSPAHEAVRGLAPTREQASTEEPVVAAPAVASDAATQTLPRPAASQAAPPEAQAPAPAPVQAQASPGGSASKKTGKRKSGKR